MKRKNNLDERQEMELLQIEHIGMWFCFWALLAAMTIQIFMGAPAPQIAGEWIIFMILCIGMLIACLRKGIWDRYLKPTRKNNILCSIIGGAVIFLFTFVNVMRNTDGQMPGSSFLAGLFCGLFTAVLCYAALAVCTHIVKKRAQKLEQADYDDE